MKERLGSSRFHVPVLALVGALLPVVFGPPAAGAQAPGAEAHAHPAPGTGPAPETPALPGSGAVATGRAARVETAPVIDGRLEDAAWTQAQPLTGFVQFEPRLGEPGSEQTEVRILFDEDALYVGAWLYDSEPDRIIIGERRRDGIEIDTDAVLVALDTYKDGQNGFVFGTTPGAIEYDGQVRGGSGINTNWDGSWTVATSQDARGWYAEMRIPFSTLRYGLGERQVWGLNVARYVGRKNEQIFWSRVPQQFDFYRLTEAGELEGIQPPPTRVTTVTPYVLSAAQRIPRLEPGVTYPTETGVDAKIGVTPSLAIDLTYNTDFAQVEVDDQQVDLTRFNLFFPERRPFFLENSGLFAVVPDRQGPVPLPAQIFHTRRIGVENGREVPIEWGTRLSGRTQGLDVGMVYMRTEGLEGVQDPNQWAVARVARELPNRSRVGGIVTSRTSSLDAADHNRVYGVDGRLGIGEAWTFDAVGALSQTPGATRDDRMLLLTGQHLTSSGEVYAHFHHIGADFNPEVGYIRRQGFREGRLDVHRYFRPRAEWLREVRTHGWYSVAESLESGFRESETFDGHVHVDFENGASVTSNLVYNLDGLEDPFRIFGSDIVVPAGTYAGWSVTSRFSTSSSRPISLNGSFDSGAFLSGSKTGASAGVAFRHGGTLTGGFNVTHNRIRLAQGDFNTTLSRVRLRYAFTPSLSVQTSVQYSDQSDIWNGFVRLGWINTAGTGLYLVYNERQNMDAVGLEGLLPRDALAPGERTLVVKYTHQFDVSKLSGSLF